MLYNVTALAVKDGECSLGVVALLIEKRRGMDKARDLCVDHSI